jgi:catechol 2,3-dioxygenase-like lactoylglutathione lyase family enzyme
MMPDVAHEHGPEPGTDLPQGPDPSVRAAAGTGFLHHVELWVPDLARAERSWGWLLTRLGAEPFQHWEHGRSWRSGDSYVVLEQSPALAGDRHDRRSPGVNHLAFWVPGHPRPDRGEVDALDALVAEAPAHGWTLLFPDRHPWAGGPDHRAAYLEDGDGYEVELVPRPPVTSPVRTTSPAPAAARLSPDP